MYQQVNQKLVKAARGVVKECSICQKKFDLFLREHICKRCLRPVCSECSPKKLIIVGYDLDPKVKHRVCIPCKTDSKFQKKIRKDNKLQFGQTSDIAKRWLQSLNLLTTTESHSELQDLEDSFKKAQQKGLIENIEVTQMKKQLSYSFRQFAFQTQTNEITDADVSRMLVSVLNKLAYRFDWKTLPHKYHLITYFMLHFANEAVAYHLLVEIQTNYIPSYAIEYMTDVTQSSQKNMTQNQKVKIQKMLNYLISQYKYEDFESKQVQSFIQFIGMEMISTLFVDILSIECVYNSFDEMITKNTFMEVERIFIMLVRYHHEYIKYCTPSLADQYQSIILHMCRNTSISLLKEKCKGEKSFESSRTDTFESKIFRQSTTNGSEAPENQTQSISNIKPQREEKDLQSSNAQNTILPQADRQYSSQINGNVTESDNSEDEEKEQVSEQFVQNSVQYAPLEQETFVVHDEEEHQVSSAQESQQARSEEWIKQEKLLRAEIIQYQRTITIKEEENRKITNELKQTKNQLTTVQSELSAVQQQLANAPQQTEQKPQSTEASESVQFEQFKYEIEQKNIQISNLYSSLDELVKRSAGASNENETVGIIEELRTEISQKTVEIQTLTRTLVQSEEKYKLLESMNTENKDDSLAEIRALLVSKNAEIDSLVERLNAGEEKHRQLDNTNQQQVKEIDELKLQNGQKNVEIENIILSLTQSNEKYSLLEVTIKQYISSIEELKAQVQQKTIETQNLQRQLTQSEERYKTLESSQTQNTTMHPHNNACIDQLWKELQQLQSKVEVQREEKVTMEQQLLSEKEEIVVAHVRELTLLKSEIQEYQQKIIKREEKISQESVSLTQKIELLEKTIQEKEVLIQQQLTQITTLTTEVTTLKESEASLYQELTNKSEQSSVYSTSVETQVRELQANLESMRASNTSLIQEHKTLMDLTTKNNNLIFEELKQQILELEETIKTQKVQIDEATQREIVLKDEVENQKTEVEALKKQVTQLEQQLKQKEESVDDLNSQLMQKSAQFKTEIEIATVTISEEQRKNVEISQYLEESRAETLAVKQELQTTEAKLLEARREIENKTLALYESEQELIALRKEVEDKRIQIATLSTEVEQVKTQVIALTEVVNQKTVENAALTKDIEQKKVENATLTKEVEERRNEIVTLREDIEYLRKEFVVVTQKLQVSQATIIEIKKEVEAKIVVINELNEEIIFLKAQKHPSENRIQKAEQTTESCRNELYAILEKLKVTEVAVVELKREIEENILKITETNNEINLLKEEQLDLSNDKAKQIENKILRCQQSIVQCNAIYTNIHAEITILQTQVTEIKHQVEVKITIVQEREEEIARLKKQIADGCELHDKTIARLKKKVQKLETEIGVFQNIFASVKNTVGSKKDAEESEEDD